MARQNSCLKELVYNNERFFYSKKHIKFLRLRINEKGELILSIPYFCPFSTVYKFLDDSKEWIKRSKQAFKQKSLNEEELIFLAKKYKIIFNTHAKKTYFNKNTIISPNQKSLDLFLRKNAQKIFLFYLKKWSRKTGLIYTHLSIKNMKTRWGSCNYNKAYINLNLKLLQKSLKAIEYVILHELAHLKFPNHAKEFYHFIEYFMNDFRQREKEFLS
ncbi:M48 family metallopeptidase [Campylobacter hepaticus]|uniref:M48 family peptidase n=1 Tax=Campylobacter hepaticus TaxID=1813019 RepID=A0A424Z1E6_9BACT|nr:SprT family zinc-dependent metalloprotease [Campylobacter hepaticus]AXP08776.1 M48 family peptidase [Campylobacter hepaticus]MCZ0772627.1 M48 family metallopeptidase [Campylobacter hepaticus]MCZ0774095.1 M48 family metallopeptidase [Campylobacter hepaticus]MCZ0775347.1 M48 family metallopeptidase [Campylobacter hepaticus]MDX2323059.1 SprT family zinc-dependent metalloprotease [Campylobacter hepaticus]